MMKPPLIVYYDGECGFCTRAMERWRARDRRGRPARIIWRNLHEHAAELAALGIPFEVAKARLHAVDAEGRVAAGARAVAAMWDQFPLWRPLAALLRLPGMVVPAEAIYDWVARHR